MIKRLLILLGLYLLIGFQISIANPVPQLGWDVDTILLFLLVVSFFIGKGEGILWAAFAGFALDSFVPESMGGNIVSKSSVLFIFALLSNSMNLEQPMLLGSIVAGLALVERLIFRLFTPYIASFGRSVLRYDIPSALLTGIFGFIIIVVLFKIGLISRTPRTD